MTNRSGQARLSHSAKTEERHRKLIDESVIYRQRFARTNKAKLNDFGSPERIRHLILSDQITPSIIRRISNTADMVKDIRSDVSLSIDLSNLLANRRAALYFSQPSTRTYASFVAACQSLGITYVDFRNLQSSSNEKGENIVDAMRMLGSYNDAVIIRSEVPHHAELTAYLMNEVASTFDERAVNVLNAGSGTEEHPTQALLDAFTILKNFDFESELNRPYSRQKLHHLEGLARRNPNVSHDLNNKLYGFVGDLGRGRTVRSLVKILSQYHDVKFAFISNPSAPNDLPDEIRLFLRNRGINFEIYDDLSQVISDLDLLYVTRIQSEYDEKNKSFDPIVVDRALVEKMKEYACVMHPFPRNTELAGDVDFDRRARYFEQAKNGVPVRAALLAHMFDQENAVLEIHETLRRDF